MFFIIREAAGWLLVATALYLINLALRTYIPRGDVVEAGLLVMASMFVFKGGVSLVRVATAARICMPTRDAPSKRNEPGVRN